MTYKYMSQETPLAFPASTQIASTVYLNTDKTQFKLMLAPSVAELQAGIEEYAAKRAAILWREMAKIENDKCRLFACSGNSFTNVSKAAVTVLLGSITTGQALRQELRGQALVDAIAKLEPTGWAEVEALYRLRYGRECAIGRDYFLGIVANSATAFDFFGKLIDTLLESVAHVDPTRGTMPMTFHQPRVYEFLGFAVTKGWLLFPFLHGQSGVREQLLIGHHANAGAAFGEEYRPPEVSELFTSFAAMKVARTTEVGREIHLRNLMLASSFRSVEQATTPLLQVCIDIISESEGVQPIQHAGKVRKTYNGLLRLHNSRCPAAPVQAVIANTRESVSVNDFASFDDVRQSAPQLSTWCEWFERFVRETMDSQGQVRKTACTEFAGFLSSLPTPPQSCPQCRFFLTGPAFLLGQCIEGNQLILKIRKKVQALDALRTSILEFEDAGNLGQADVLRAQTDVEERHLNDMLTEWWHRMKLYEASVHKLEAYRRFLEEKQSGDGRLMLVADKPSDDLSFSFKQSTDLELEHFLSTCAELLPNYAQESKAVALDLEMAVGKFLAINDHKDLTSMYFTLTDEQRLTAANLAVELLLGSAEDPSKAADLLEGRTPLSSLPSLQKSLADMLIASSKASARKAIRIVAVDALK